VEIYPNSMENKRVLQVVTDCCAAFSLREPSARLTKTPYRIGFVGGLTGRSSDLGVPGAPNGVMLAR